MKVLERAPITAGVKDENQILDGGSFGKGWGRRSYIPERQPGGRGVQRSDVWVLAELFLLTQLFAIASY